jgi:hypothetical protein
MYDAGNYVCELGFLVCELVNSDGAIRFLVCDLKTSVCELRFLASYCGNPVC